MELHRITDRLVRRLRRLTFGPPVACVYNPLEYARGQYDAYLQRFGVQRPREVVLLGMNPGPWGMVQTGVPFGEVALVRDWLHLCEPIEPPRCQHPARPIRGLQCTRREVSGARLWGWARARFGTPERFAARFFIANYCPLAFLEDSGRNRTPDKLPAPEREPLLAACDEALRATVEYLRPRFAIGVGGFAASRARIALAGLDVTIGQILHPSPASPAANGGWAERIEEQLRRLGVALPLSTARR